MDLVSSKDVLPLMEHLAECLLCSKLDENYYMIRKYRDKLRVVISLHCVKALSCVRTYPKHKTVKTNDNLSED